VISASSNRTASETQNIASQSASLVCEKMLYASQILMQGKVQASACLIRFQRMELIIEINPGSFKNLGNFEANNQRQRNQLVEQEIIRKCSTE
jgi:hypothetical protein